MENREVGISVGMIIPYASNGAIPEGFLLCNGAEVLTSTYPSLFAVIGYTYGGSGNKFRLPDLRDKFIEGNDVAGGDREAGLPNIEGKFSIPKSASKTDSNGSNKYEDSGAFSISDTASSITGASNSGWSGTAPIHMFNASNSSDIYGKSNTVQPPALTMRYIIRAFAGASSSSTDLEITRVANEVNALAVKVETGGVAEQGDGYIRYTNGLQICWGNFYFAIGSGASNGGFDGPDFPRPFVSKPIVTVSPDGPYGEYLTVHTQSTTNTTIYGWYKMNNSSHDASTGLNYIAIGQWK